jgi:hypothetical protein
MALEPHAVVIAVATSGVCVLMALAGVEKRTLEWRRRSRACPSCGQPVRRGVCGCR